MNEQDNWPFPTESPNYKIRYVYVRQGLGGYSYAFAYRKVLHRAGGKFVDVAVAVCSPKDQFSRKVARTLCLERLNGGTYITLPLAIDGDKYIDAMLHGMFQEYM